MRESPLAILYTTAVDLILYTAANLASECEILAEVDLTVIHFDVLNVSYNERLRGSNEQQLVAVRACDHR